MNGTVTGPVVARVTAAVDEIKELNPQLKLERTRNDEASTVRVPATTEAAP